jgi:hypothetical protein
VSALRSGNQRHDDHRASHRSRASIAPTRDPDEAFRAEAERACCVLTAAIATVISAPARRSARPVAPRERASAHLMRERTFLVAPRDPRARDPRSAIDPRVVTCHAGAGAAVALAISLPFIGLFLRMILALEASRTGFHQQLDGLLEVFGSGRRSPPFARMRVSG